MFELHYPNFTCKFQQRFKPKHSNFVWIEFLISDKTPAKERFFKNQTSVTRLYVLRPPRSGHVQSLDNLQYAITAACHTSPSSVSQ